VQAVSRSSQSGSASSYATTDHRDIASQLACACQARSRQKTSHSVKELPAAG
jgi:hypothetical protein